MVFTVLGILAVFGLSLVYAIRFVKVRDRRGVVVQGMYRSNFLILGLPRTVGHRPRAGAGGRDPAWLPRH